MNVEVVMPKKKTVKFNKSGVNKLPNDKPVTYKIKTEGGKTNYIGSAKRGRVTARIKEHIERKEIPGAKVEIERLSTIAEARNKENRAIKRTKPKYNKNGK